MSAAGKRVLITGVSSRWGSELARRLERDDRVGSVVGLDLHPPREPLPDLEFVEADIRNPVIGRMLPRIAPDVVVHCGIVWYPEEDKPARALHDINVIGTLQLLAACEKIESLQAVVVRGSAAIYGSHASAPAFFKEEMARRYPLVTRFQRDVGELESYFVNFARRHPSVVCCMLRLQPVIGPQLDDPLVRYLTLPVVPVQMGFDPMIQFLHAEDATGALAAAALAPVPGAVNVAPDGAISLIRALRLLGRVPLPVPSLVVERVLSGPGQALLGAADMYSDGMRLLRHGRGCDNGRLRAEVGYEPVFDAEGAIGALAEERGRSCFV